MKRKTLFIAAILIVSTLAAVPFLYGGPGRGGHGPHGGFGGDFGDMGMLGHLQKAKEELGLSDQQVDQIKVIFGSLREQNEQYRSELRGGMASIAQTLIADPNNVSAAQALLDKQSSAEKAIKTNVLTATAQALNVLTPEQRTKLGTMISEHMARRESGRGSQRR